MDIRLLCPACRGALSEGLECSSCHAVYRRDGGSEAVILREISEETITGAAAEWDEIWQARALDPLAGAGRIRQRRALLDPQHVSRRVLDVGVGSGFNVALFDAGALQAYVGVDLSLSALHGAHRTLSRAGVRHLLVCCDASRFLPLEGRFDTIVIFGVLYQFAWYLEMLASILERHAHSGTVVYGAEPVDAISSPYLIQRVRFLDFLRARGDVKAQFMEGLVFRMFNKLGGPRWLLDAAAQWATARPRLSPFARYLQYRLTVTHD